MGLMDQNFFAEALNRKYNILQQNADTAAQEVGQKPGMADAANIAALQRTQMDNQGRLQAEQLRGGFGLQERELFNQGQLNTANVAGNFGLQEAGIKAEGALQPKFSALKNENYLGQPDEPPYFLTPDNISAIKPAEAYNRQRSKPVSLPFGKSYLSLGTQGLGLGLPGYRRGGPVEAGDPIQVGEDGQELFVPAGGGKPAVVGQAGTEAIVPRVDGVIVPHDKAAGLGLRQGPLTARDLDNDALTFSPGQPQRVASAGYQTTAPVPGAVTGFGLREMPATRQDRLGLAGSPASAAPDGDYARRYQQALFNQGADAVKDWAVPDPGQVAPVLTNRPNDREVLVANAIRRGGQPDFAAGVTTPPRHEGDAIYFDGRMIDPGRGLAGAPTKFDPAGFHTEMAGMGSKEAQTAAYAALSPEQKSAWRQWKASQDAAPAGFGLQPMPATPEQPARRPPPQAADAPDYWDGTQIFRPEGEVTQDPPRLPTQRELNIDLENLEMRNRMQGMRQSVVNALPQSVPTDGDYWDGSRIVRPQGEVVRTPSKPVDAEAAVIARYQSATPEQRAHLDRMYPQLKARAGRQQAAQ